MNTHFPLPPLLAVLFVWGTVLSPAHAQSSFPSQRAGQVPTEALTPDVKRRAQAAVHGPDGKKEGPLSKVGMALAILYYQHERAGTAGIRALRSKQTRRSKETGAAGTAARTHLPTSSDGRFVTVDAVAAGSSSELLAALRGLGLEDGATAGTVVSGRLPIASIAEAARLGALRGMMPSYVRTRAGRAGSEADTAHRALDVRSTLGVNGRGQKICALSDSYDRDGDAPTSATDDIQSGDLPGGENPEGRTTPVDVLDDDYDESVFPTPIDEGRAMLQLIHDMAPGAQLGFHTAFGGIANFANAIRELAGPGNCTVIVDDIGYFAQPFYQDGPVSNAVDDVVADRIPYVSSAGNDGQNSYEAPFRGSGEAGVLDSGSEPHDFDPSGDTDTRQEITVQAGGTFQVVSLQWTDPSSLVDGSEGADTDLDLALLRGGEVVSQSADDNRTTGVPFETTEYTNDTGQAVTLNLVIEKAAGPDPQEVKYIYGGIGFTINEYDTLGPTIYGHPAAEGALAVAAAPFYYTPAYCESFPENCLDGRSPPYLESFSSKGGIPLRFDQQGREMSAVTRQKPDVTGTDGVDNTFFGSDIANADFMGIDGDTNPNFFGTSAAAPNIAAVAALIRQARPTLSPQEVYDRLESTAVDVTERIVRGGGALAPVEAGPDPWGGHGFVRADRAVPEPRGVQIVDLAGSASTSGGTGRVDLQWTLVGQETADEFVLEKQYFEGRFTEQERVAVNGGTDFGSTVSNLPAGRYTFRVTAVRNGDAVAESTTEVVLQREGPTVSLYPNPFRRAANLSVTLGPNQGPEDVRVVLFDALGRRVGVPVSSRTVEEARSIRLGPEAVGALGAGVYFFRVEGRTFTRTIQGVHVP
jgi:hypothetical protein